MFSVTTIQTLLRILKTTDFVCETYIATMWMTCIIYLYLWCTTSRILSVVSLVCVVCYCVPGKIPVFPFLLSVLFFFWTAMLRYIHPSVCVYVCIYIYISIYIYPSLTSHHLLRDLHNNEETSDGVYIWVSKTRYSYRYPFSSSFWSTNNTILVAFFFVFFCSFLYKYPPPRKVGYRDPQPPPGWTDVCIIYWVFAYQ